MRDRLGALLYGATRWLGDHRLQWAKAMVATANSTWNAL
jgi:hypothetical protein